MWRIFHTFAIITDIVDLQLYCYMKNLRYLVLACAVLTGVSMTSLTNKTSSRRLIVPIAFYNLENLFDTIHDVLMDTINGVPVKIADKNDYEYLPDGTNHWNTMKYNAKLKNMSYALSQFAIDVNERGPAVIGVSEVENRRVLEDLVQQPALKERGYKIIHEEGPDRRGVDCAFIYNPRMFRYDHHKLVPYVYPNNDTTHATRGFLVASGKILREDVSLIVCHWPSRFSTGFYRGLGGRQVRAIKETRSGNTNHFPICAMRSSTAISSSSRRDNIKATRCVRMAEVCGSTAIPTTSQRLSISQRKCPTGLTDQRNRPTDDQSTDNAAFLTSEAVCLVKTTTFLLTAL